MALRICKKLESKWSNTILNEKAQAGLAAYRERVASGEIVVVQKNPMDRHLDDPKSIRKAVHAQCFDCMGRSSGYRVDIRGCTSNGCPLFNFRPYK